MLDANGSGKPSPHPETSTLATGVLISGFITALKAEANGSLTVVLGLLIAEKGSIEAGMVKGSAVLVDWLAIGWVFPIPEKMSLWGFGCSTSFIKPNSSLTWGVVSVIETDSSGRVASL
jgi:hypothetical protein